MKVYVWLSFAFMGWAYYEMSGGSDFAPETAPEMAVADAGTVANDVDVTRANSASLLAIAPETDDAQVILASAPADDTASDAAVAAAVTDALALQDVDSAPTTEEIPGADLRAVAGVRVNMRQGPGTDYGVIVTLSQGTEVEVIEVDADGWARLIVPATGEEGWMAARLLTDPA